MNVSPWSTFFERSKNVVRRAVLHHVSPHAQIHRGVEHVLFVIHGEKDRRHRRFHLLQRPHHFQTAEARHINVHNRDVRLQIRNHLHRRLAIGSFADNAEARILLDDLAQAAPEHRMIIHNQQFHFTLLHASEPETGISMLKLVPWPGRESITNVPPRMRTRSLIPLMP